MTIAAAPRTNGHELPGGGRCGAVHGLLALLLLVAAALLRGLYLALPEIDADMAMWGVQAIDILHGRFHLFFSGELFSGSLEAWLAAPLFALLGASARVLCLVPFAVSLALVWAVWRLACRELGPWPGLLAMAWVAVPPFYLAQHSVWPLGGYIEVPLLAVLCFGLTLRLDRQCRAGAPGRAPAFLLGLAWGLGLWLHLLMLPAVLATGGYLLVRHPRLLLSRLLPWLGLGSLLGGLPLWVFSIPAGLLRPEVLRQGRALNVVPAVRDLGAQGLPLALGLPERRVLGPAWSDVRVGIEFLYGAVLALLAWAWRPRSAAQRPRGGALLALALGYLGIYLAVWVYSGAHSQNTWRHLTPLYAGFPFVVAACVAGRAGLHRRAGLVLGLLALTLNLWGSLKMAPWLNARQRLVFQSRREGEAALFAGLRREGLLHVYGQWFWDALPLTLAGGGEITVADQLENHFPRLTLEADASPRPAYVVTTRSVDFDNTLAAAGITARRDDIAQFHLYRDFQWSLPALSLIVPAGWRSAQPGGERAWDRDLSTAYTDDLPQLPGQTFRVDLGRVEPALCFVEVLSGPYEQAAGGLELWSSLDGREWRLTASQTGTAFGALAWSMDRPLLRFLPARQQLAFSPQPARFLELRQTQTFPARTWSVAELFAYRADGPRGVEPTPSQLAGAIAALPGRGPVYAPAAVLALLPEGRRGLADPQLPPTASFPLGRLHLTLEPGAVICLPTHEWAACRGLLEARLSAPPQTREVGSWVLISDLRPAAPALVAEPLPGSATARASLHPEAARKPLKRRSGGSRWRTGAPQAAGQWFELDLGREMTIAGVSLDSGLWPRERPLGLRVEIRTDQGPWREVGAALASGAPLAWGGERLLLGAGPLWASFAPQPVRGVRLTQTGSHPRLEWTIAGIGLLRAAP
jgi:hypothetical protein